MRRSRLTIFLVSTYLITWTSWWLLASLAGRGIITYGQAPFMTLYMLGGLGPTIAAYISVARTKGEGSIGEFHSRLLKWRIRIPFYLAALLIPLGIGGATAAIMRLIDSESYATKLLPWYMFFPLFGVMILGGGLEEVGWRGVALPELQRRLHPLATSAVLGVIWSLWHLPLFFIRGVNQYAMNFFVFSLEILGLTCVLTWIYNRVGSILLCVVLHAASNTAYGLGLEASTGRIAGSVIEGLIWLCVGVALLVMSHKRAVAATYAQRSARQR